MSCHWVYKWLGKLSHCFQKEKISSIDLSNSRDKRKAPEFWELNS